MIDNENLKALLTPACERYRVKNLSLFGSRVSGANVKSDSDYDFLVEFDEDSKEKLSDRFFGLLFYLEDHLDSEIDLLQRDAISNPYLLATIDKNKKIIYGSRD